MSEERRCDRSRPPHLLLALFKDSVSGISLSGTDCLRQFTLCLVWSKCPDTEASRWRWCRASTISRVAEAGHEQGRALSSAVSVGGGRVRCWQVECDVARPRGRRFRGRISTQPQHPRLRRARLLSAPPAARHTAIPRDPKWHPLTKIRASTRTRKTSRRRSQPPMAQRRPNPNHNPTISNRLTKVLPTL